MPGKVKQYLHRLLNRLIKFTLNNNIISEKYLYRFTQFEVDCVDQALKTKSLKHYFYIFCHLNYRESVGYKGFLKHST